MKDETGEPRLVPGVDRQAGGNWYRGTITFRNCGLDMVVCGKSYPRPVDCPHAHQSEARALECAKTAIRRIRRA
jgi:hypothetical protein